ncbi:YggS family pyridoxal phosphate-dependent enzyme [soil metagenome]
MGLAERLEVVQASIARAVVEAGRDSSEITTIVVTKFHPASLVRELAALGVRDVGENRHQEASAKAAELADLDLHWHYIGQLQSNKAKAVRRYASAVHSIDRASVLPGLGSDTGSIDAFVQVDLSGEPGRGGVAPEGLDALIDAVLGARGIRLRGLMTVAPLGAEPRAAFARLRELSGRVQKQAPDATSLSMGMSGDYREAILEGATHLRIGTAITGNRLPHP